MAKKTINIGSSVNKGDGDPLRTAFGKINDNFDEIYGAIATDGTIFNPLSVDSHLLPDGDNTRDLGSPAKRWRDIFVAPGSLYIGDIKLTNVNGKLVATKVINPGEANEALDPTDSNAGSEIGSGGNAFDQSLNTADSVTFNSVGATTVNVSQINGTNPGDELVIQANNNNWNFNNSGALTFPQGTTIATADGTDAFIIDGAVDKDIQIYTYSGPTPTAHGWTFGADGNLQLPVGGDIVDSTGTSVLGGAAGPVQPYLELTNSAFIIQPVELGSPVTVSTAGDGSGAEVEVVIGEGPVITSVTVTTPGTDYIVGQRYRVWFDQIGGNNDDSSIEFEVATVSSGGLLTVTDAAFTGETAANNPGTYSNLSIQLRASPGDSIGPGLTLVRSYQGALFNIEAESEYDNVSPIGTEWNNDGWDNLVGLNTRSYGTFYTALNGAVGNNIIGAELVMHDTINDKYYKFSFTDWGQNNGGSYAYTRTEITDPNYFKKENYATVNNVDVIEDDSTLQIGITRGNNNGIYNPFTEEGWDEDVSPDGTEWNTDGWDDLTDIETRIYTNFYDAYNGQLGNRVPGSQAVMYVPSIDKYYAIQWLSWTQNNAGGGFSYLRYEIDLTKLNEGIQFADGTILKSAEGIGRIKSTASGNRRIEEATGNNTVSVTSLSNIFTETGVLAERPGESPQWDVWVDRASYPNIDSAFTEYGQYSNDESYWQLTLNGIDYKQNVQVYINGDYFVIYTGGINVNYNTGDAFNLYRVSGGTPVVWWDKNTLPSGGGNFRGAVIDYHAYTGESTIIGTIHIVDDDGEENITHTEVSSGSTDGENDDLWLVTNEGQIKYRRLDGESKTLKIHWSAKIFYGSEYYD